MPITSIEQVTDTAQLQEYLDWILDQLDKGMSAAEGRQRIAEADKLLKEMSMRLRGE
jgi:hypothetical protein